MNDGEKSVKLYSDDKNMMMSKMKYHENKDMVSMMVIVARTYCDASYTPLPCSQTAMGPRSAVMSSFTSTPITPTT